MSDKLVSRIDAVIRARNTAQQAAQRFADAHLTRKPGEVSDDLYEATYELVNRLDCLIDSVDWQDMVLGN